MLYYCSFVSDSLDIGHVPVMPRDLLMLYTLNPLSCTSVSNKCFERFSAFYVSMAILNNCIVFKVLLAQRKIILLFQQKFSNLNVYFYYFLCMKTTKKLWKQATFWPLPLNEL
jgi:hypothetical protein